MYYNVKDFIASWPSCIIEYECVPPTTGPDICAGGVLNPSRGIWKFVSKDEAIYPYDTYNIKIKGYIVNSKNGKPTKSSKSITFTVKFVDPCSTAILSVPPQPDNPADYAYSGLI